MTTPTPTVPIFGREPVAILAAVQAVIAMAIGFGLKLEPPQFALVMVALTALTALASRSQVVAVTALEALDPRKSQR